MSDSANEAVGTETEVKLVTLESYQAGAAAIVDNLVPVDVSATLTAANWVTTTVSDVTTHTYPLSITIASKYRSVICSLSPNATNAQSSTMTKAKIESISYDSANEILSIVATGVKPTIDIPIVVQLATVSSVAEMPRYVDGEVPIATPNLLGICKPDGTSITITNDGTISADLSGKMDAITGIEGQIIGFDENGDPKAQDMPSNGHIVVDESGVSYTQRSKLQFPNATITDDSANDTTIVDTEIDFTDIISELETTAKYGTIKSSDEIITSDGDTVVTSSGNPISITAAASTAVKNYFTNAYYTARALSGESLSTIADDIDAAS